MDKKYDELIDELLEKIGSMLYQDNKYSDKEMAEIIVKLLEEKYDIQ